MTVVVILAAVAIVFGALWLAGERLMDRRRGRRVAHLAEGLDVEAMSRAQATEIKARGRSDAGPG